MQTGGFSTAAPCGTLCLTKCSLMVYATACRQQLRRRSEAERIGARLKVEASAPALLPVSDTELCALLSNGLETR